MGRADYAIDRMKSRYSYVSAATTVLGETWAADSAHAYNGAPILIPYKYLAGIAPETAGYATYHVFPHLCYLNLVNAVVPSVKGDIAVHIQQDSLFTLQLTSPGGTVATVGIPKTTAATQVTVNGSLIWKGSYIGGVSGISWNGEEGDYYKFNAGPGTWRFESDNNRPVSNSTATYVNRPR
jgi:hypothetical protein